MIRRSMYIIACGLLAVLISGCGMSEAKADAENIVGTYFKALQQGDYDLALEDYSPLFFEETSKQEWKNILISLNNELGDLQDYHLEQWRVTSTINGNIILLAYRTSYAKSEAQEQITLMFSDEIGKYQIVGHNIDPETLRGN